MAGSSFNIKIVAENLASAAFSKIQSDLGKLDTSFKTTGNNLKSMGGFLTAGVTVPLTAVGGASLKAAIDFETAFTGVRKTVDATEAEFGMLEEGIRDMAKELPASTEEIAGVAEAAGQLGVKTEDILSFSRVMIDLGNTTNLSSNEAATSLARFMTVMGTSQSNVGNLGSVIVDLGNNFETTEAEILTMASKLKNAGKVIGLSESQVLGMSTALTSVDINADAGGTAFSKLMIKIAAAVSSGGEDLEGFADVAGMSAEEFGTAFRKDAGGAIISFVEGLGKVKQSSDKTFQVMEDLGLSEVRLRNAVLGVALAGDKLREATDRGGEAWIKNTALTEEAEKKYGTTASQLKKLRGKVEDLAISLGKELVPMLLKAIEKLEPFIKSIKDAIEWFSELGKTAKTIFVGSAAVLAIGGPALAALGAMIGFISTLVGTVGLPALTGAFVALGAIVATVSSNTEGFLKKFEKLVGLTEKATSPLALLQNELKLNQARVKSYRKELELLEPGSIAWATQSRRVNIAIADQKDILKRMQDVLKEDQEAKEKAIKQAKIIAEKLAEEARLKREKELEAQKQKEAEALRVQELTEIARIANGQRKIMEDELAEKTKIKLDESMALIESFNLNRQEAELGSFNFAVAKIVEKAEKLEAAGLDEVALEQWIADELEKLYEKDSANKKSSEDEKLKKVVDIADLQKQAVKGVTDAIKGLWDGSEKDFDDAWKGALNTFVDVMGEMVVQALIFKTEVDIAMASATAGLSLVIGLLGVAFGGFGSKTGSGIKSAAERMREVFDDFIDNFDKSLERFGLTIDSTGKRLMSLGSAQAELFVELNDELNRFSRLFRREASLQRLIDEERARLAEIDDKESSVTLRNLLANLRLVQNEIANTFTSITDKTAEINQMIFDRYDEEQKSLESIMGTIGDIDRTIRNLQDSQKEFVTSIGKDIIDVSRMGFSPEQLFDALTQDVAKILGQVRVLRGEDRISALQELRDLQLERISVAERVFGLNSPEFLAIQTQVVQSLQEIQSEGSKEFDSMIDIQRDQLEELTGMRTILQAQGVTQSAMIKLREERDEALQQALTLGTGGITTAEGIQGIMDFLTSSGGIDKSLSSSVVTAGVQTANTFTDIASATRINAINVMKQRISDRYDEEQKSLDSLLETINDIGDAITELQRSQSDFVTSIGKDITDIERMGLAPEELVGVLAQDVAKIQDEILTLSGEDKIDALRKLRDIELDRLSEAERAFGLDSPEFLAIQNEVIDSLKEIQSEGSKEFDSMIDIQRDQLDELTGMRDALSAQEAVQNRMLELQIERDEALQQAVTVGTGGISTAAFLAGVGIIENFLTSATPFAEGGIVKSPTLAMAGEAGDEAFVRLKNGKIPVEVNNGEGASSTTINFNIQSLDGEDVERVIVRKIIPALRTNILDQGEMHTAVQEALV